MRFTLAKKTDIKRHYKSKRVRLNNRRKVNPPRLCHKCLKVIMSKGSKFCPLCREVGYKEYNNKRRKYINRFYDKIFKDYDYEQLQNMSYDIWYVLKKYFQEKEDGKRRHKKTRNRRKD